MNTTKTQHELQCTCEICQKTNKEHVAKKRWDAVKTYIKEHQKEYGHGNAFITAMRDSSSMEILDEIFDFVIHSKTPSWFNHEKRSDEDSDEDCDCYEELPEIIKNMTLAELRIMGIMAVSKPNLIDIISEKEGKIQLFDFHFQYRFSIPII